MSLHDACRIRLTTTVLAWLSVVAAGGCWPAPPPAETEVAGERVRRHIEALASDEMQGREAATTGYLMAADYVASRFRETGLTRMGDGDSYFQEVPLLETRLVPGSESMVLHHAGRSVELERGTDYLRSGGFGDVVESVMAPLLFVGFGIQAPEYHHDDFASIDASGKILVVFTGAPPSFEPDERAFYSSSAGKQALAVAHRALGILTIRTPVDQERMTWPRMRAAASSAAMRWVAADGRGHDAFPQLAGDAMLGDPGAKKLFELAGRDLAALFERYGSGSTGSFDLGVSATLRRESVQRQVSSPNVLALLPGGDLADEYVLISAHLDHLGTQDGPGSDKVYNGAYDNAAGVATMLEVASAMATMSRPPRRSVIFAAVTAEEKGLRGSDFLAHHPPVAIGKIVANINVDMPFLGYPMADVEGFGVDHSTLRTALARAAAEIGVALTPDPRPELVRLIRSDQFSFVKQGVPGLNLQPGSSSSAPALDGFDLRSAFLREHYHQPSDDLRLPFSEEGATRFAQLVLKFALHVANDDERPSWVDGDFFGERFAKKIPASSDAGQSPSQSVRP